MYVLLANLLIFDLASLYVRYEERKITKGRKKKVFHMNVFFKCEVELYSAPANIFLNVAFFRLIHTTTENCPHVF